MKAFMDKDFLLETETAKKLFHDYAEKTPILDYHCHINPKEIAEDRQFDNITQVWLGGDHYKCVSCVLAVWTKSTSPVTLPITRSSANGLSAWARLSATPCSTGAICNYRDTSVTMAF